MKTFKRLLSLVIAVLCMTSCMCFTATAATESDDPNFYFEVPDEWPIEYIYSIYCYIKEYNGRELTKWQHKTSRCTKINDHLYSINPANMGTLKDDTLYTIVFSSDCGQYTYDLLMSTECLGDTVYCTGVTFTSPYDLNKISTEAHWKNQDPAEYGSVMAINYDLEIVGTCLPPVTTKIDLLCDFLWGHSLDELRMEGNTDQEIIDTIKAKLNLTNEQVSEAISHVNITPAIKWTPSVLVPDISTPDEDATIDEVVMLGDTYKDGVVNIKDATFIQKVIAGLEQFQSEFDSKAADVNYDGTINIKDATVIQKHIAGLDTGFEDIGKYI